MKLWQLHLMQQNKEQNQPRVWFLYLERQQFMQRNALALLIKVQLQVIIRFWDFIIIYVGCKQKGWGDYSSQPS